MWIAASERTSSAPSARHTTMLSGSAARRSGGTLARNVSPPRGAKWNAPSRSAAATKRTERWHRPQPPS